MDVLYFTAAYLCVTLSNSGVRSFTLSSSPPSSQDGHVTVCPGTNITLTCSANDVATLGWSNENGQLIVFDITDTESSVVKQDPYTITLVMIEDDDGDYLANITSTLQLTVYKTATITCLIYQYQKYVDIHIRDIPSQPLGLVTTHLYQKTSFFTVLSWKMRDDEVIDEYRISTNNSTVIITNMTSVVVEGRYNTLTKLSIWAVNCVGSSHELTKEEYINGCDSPIPPVNGSVLGWTSSQVGAEVNYTCDNDLILQKDMKAVCSQFSRDWVPSGKDVNCTNRHSSKIECGIPEFMHNSVLFDELETSFFCNSGLFSNHLYSECMEGKWIVQHSALKCQKLDCQFNNTNNISCNASLRYTVITAMVTAICSLSGALMLCLILYCLRVCNNKKRSQNEATPVYEDISMEIRPHIDLSTNDAYGRNCLSVDPMKLATEQQAVV